MAYIYSLCMDQQEPSLVSMDMHVTHRPLILRNLQFKKIKRSVYMYLPKIIRVKKKLTTYKLYDIAYWRLVAPTYQPLFQEDE